MLSCTTNNEHESQSSRSGKGESISANYLTAVSDKTSRTVSRRHWSLVSTLGSNMLSNLIRPVNTTVLTSRAAKDDKRRSSFSCFSKQQASRLQQMTPAVIYLYFLIKRLSRPVTTRHSPPGPKARGRRRTPSVSCESPRSRRTILGTRPLRDPAVHLSSASPVQGRQTY